uniref:Uncharacterized protein LOC110216668 n=1 Tax=Phascolarctos cinereus TaxID=38626 RepID=A0A6P5L7B6_PHACI|nr:uncharacterized protein LOC110216668 [Phascolarctos cinereus]
MGTIHIQTWAGDRTPPAAGGGSERAGGQAGRRAGGQAEGGGEESSRVLWISTPVRAPGGPGRGRRAGGGGSTTVGPGRSWSAWRGALARSWRCLRSLGSPLAASPASRAGEPARRSNCPAPRSPGRGRGGRCLPGLRLLCSWRPEPGGREGTARGGTRPEPGLAGPPRLLAPPRRGPQTGPFSRHLRALLSLRPLPRQAWRFLPLGNRSRGGKPRSGPQKGCGPNSHSLRNKMYLGSWSQKEEKARRWLPPTTFRTLARISKHLTLTTLQQG